MDVAKKKKGKTSTQLIKPLSQFQEVNGGGLVAHLMDIGPTPQWDAPLRGMPGQGVCWSITLAAAQQQGTLPVPSFLYKFDTWKYISISRNKT